MRTLNLLTALILLTVVTVPVAWSDTGSCDHALLGTMSRLAREDAAAHLSEEGRIDRLKQRLQDEGLLSGDEARAFRAAYKLRPLLDKYLLHRAVAAVLRENGHRDTTSMRMALELFHELNNEDQQDFVESVVHRLNTILPASYALDMLDHYQTLASRLDIPTQELVVFARRWHEVNRERPDELQLFIFLTLIGHNQNTVAAITGQDTWWKRWRAWWRNDPIRYPYEPLKYIEGTNLDDMIAGKSHWRGNWLRALDNTAAVPFFQDNYDLFNYDELDLLLTADYLPNELVTQIKARQEVLSQAKALQDDIAVQEKALAAHREMTQNMLPLAEQDSPSGDAIVQQINILKTMDTDEFNIVRALVNLHKPTFSFEDLKSISDAMLDESRGEGLSYGDYFYYRQRTLLFLLALFTSYRLNQQQKLELRDVLMGIVKHFKKPAEYYGRINSSSLADGIDDDCAKLQQRVLELNERYDKLRTALE